MKRNGFAYHIQMLPSRSPRRSPYSPEEITNEAQNQIIGDLSKAKPFQPNLSVPETKALKELCSDNLTILSANKGRATVVMNKTGYV